MTSKLKEIRDNLKNYIQDELDKSPGDRDFEVFSFEEKLYEIVDSIDEIIYYDPTPSADCPYSDAEYIVTAKERSQIAFEQKLRDKG